MKKVVQTTVALMSALWAFGASAAPAANSALWLDAGKGVTTNATGIVTNWVDQSGASRNAQLMTGGAALTSIGINNRTALDFSGSTSYSLANSPVLTSQSFSIFAVVSDRAGGSGYREIFSNWNGGAGNSWDSFFFGATGNAIRFSDNFNGVGSLNYASPMILGGVNNNSSNDISLYSGTELIAERGAALSWRNLGGNYVIGRQGTLNGEYWQGTIAEVIVYDRALSKTEVNQTLNYLDTKYNVVVAVPEPENYALLLAGLGLISGIARRRQQK